jgi:hypothetical protein
MAHVNINFKTKAAFKKAVKEGQAVYVEENPIFGSEVKGGVAFISGPWETHRWYAKVEADKDGKVTKVN